MPICLSTVRNTFVFCQNTPVLFCSKRAAQIISDTTRTVRYGTTTVVQSKTERSKLVIRGKIVLYVIIKDVSISNKVSTVNLSVVVVLANQNSTSNA